ncbi:MAG: VTT domain-containing protein [Propioniciclava sp.]|uniref:DedA family protein n=1 Tax=Propioniciclava sp. TaxID=2038686 RepID=UPI0039E72B9F
MNLNPMTWDAPYPVIVGVLFVIVMCRANGTYWLGRLAARGAERTRIASVMASPRYQDAVGQLNRWGAPLVSVSFLTIGFQTLINLGAGATRMPLVRYLPAVTVGCVMWAFLYGTAGSVGFEVLARLWETHPAAAVFVGVIVVVALAVFIVGRVRESRRPSRATAVVE